MRGGREAKNRLENVNEKIIFISVYGPVRKNRRTAERFLGGEVFLNHGGVEGLSRQGDNRVMRRSSELGSKSVRAASLIEGNTLLGLGHENVILSTRRILTDLVTATSGGRRKGRSREGERLSHEVRSVSVVN